MAPGYAMISETKKNKYLYTLDFLSFSEEWPKFPEKANRSAPEISKKIINTFYYRWQKSDETQREILLKTKFKLLLKAVYHLYSNPHVYDKKSVINF